MKSLGTMISVAGLLLLAYGAIAFWVIQSLPPNGGVGGRLPSLYLMGAGIVSAMVGLALKDLRFRAGSYDDVAKKRHGIPTGLGVLLLLAIVVAFFVVVSFL